LNRLIQLDYINPRPYQRNQNMAMPPSTRVCAAALRVPADPTRLGVARLLLEHPRRVRELNALLGIDQSLLSDHPGVMRDAGLVFGERDGKAARDRLSPALIRGTSNGGLDLGCCTLTFQEGLRS